MRNARRLLSLPLLLCLGLFTAQLQAAQTLRYVVLVDGGTRAGQQVTTFGDDGSVRTEFIYKDNGRGPELTEDYRLAADGSFASYRVRGRSTFGAPIDERFAMENGVARWKSNADSGERAQPGGAMYSPIDGTPQVFSAYLRALAQRSDGVLPLLPGGQLRTRVVDRAELREGAASRSVQLLSATGLGMSPSFVWVTTDAQPRLFAAIAPGAMQLIEEGWQAHADALEARQKAAEAQVLVDLQRRMAHPLPGATLIHNVRVFDSEAATLGAPTSVLIRNGRIVQAGAGNWGSDDHGATAQRMQDVRQVLDGGGRVLLPGLIDAHAHTDRWSGGLDIAAGVTTVRDMGNDNDTLQQMIVEEGEGRLLGPRVVPLGFLEGESPMSARNGFVISTLDQAKQAIDWYVAHHYPQLKIYNSFPKEILAQTVAYAHSKGMRVSGHVPVHLRAQDVLDAGYDEIQHINQVLLNFLVKPDTDTRTLERFYLPARELADLDLDSKPVQDFIAELVRRKTVIDPTLTAFQFISHRAGEPFPAHAPVIDHLPPDLQRRLHAAEMDIPDDATAQRYARSFAKMVDFVGRMYRAGVPIVAGTDDIPGFTMHSELAYYVQAGLTPAQALQVATRNNARHSGVLDDRGVIAPGRRADLVLVDGDPTTDISAIRRIATVIKGDTVYYPSEIYAELGIRPFVEPVKVQATP